MVHCHVSAGSGIGPIWTWVTPRAKFRDTNVVFLESGTSMAPYGAKFRDPKMAYSHEG